MLATAPAKTKNGLRAEYGKVLIFLMDHSLTWVSGGSFRLEIKSYPDPRPISPGSFIGELAVELDVCHFVDDEMGC